jgi:hypothetical protein
VNVVAEMAVAMVNVVVVVVVIEEVAVAVVEDEIVAAAVAYDALLEGIQKNH